MRGGAFALVIGALVVIIILLVLLLLRLGSSPSGVKEVTKEVTTENTQPPQQTQPKQQEPTNQQPKQQEPTTQ